MGTIIKKLEPEQGYSINPDKFIKYARVGCVTADSDGIVTSVNDMAENLYDACSRRRLVGKHISECGLHPEMVDALSEAIEGHQTKSRLVICGNYRQFLTVRGVPLPLEDNESDAGLIFFHDITYAISSECKQRSFVTNVSHELRTPISAIRAAAEALLNGAKYNEAFLDKFLNNIVIECDRLACLVDGILDISRWDAGKTDIKRDHYDLRTLLLRADDIVAYQAKERNITINVNAPTDCNIYCNDALIVKAVINLLTNAIKYSHDGQQVWLSAKPEGSRIYISVKDEGIGIPESEHSRIFDRFYRVDKSRTRSNGGDGLGLAIVKEIVEATNGEIFVESKLSKGTTITFYIPNTDL